MKNDEKQKGSSVGKPKARPSRPREPKRKRGASARRAKSVGLQPEAVNLTKMLETLKPHDHLCLLYESYQEWRAAVVPFMTIGLKRGEKCAYIIDISTTDEIRRCLREEGVDVTSAEESGQLFILPETKAYTKEGSFDPDRMIALLIAETKKAIAEGYPALRVTGEMSWVLRGHPGSEKLLEYEAKLNRDLFPNYPCLAICQYDRWKFDPEIIKGIVMTHPLLIRGNQVYRNFYYIPPGEFLNKKRTELEVQHWLNNLEREKGMWEELRQSEERYRTTLMSVGDGVITTDANGRVELLNPVAEALTGWTQDEAHGRPLEEVFRIINEETRQEVENPVRRVVREGLVVGLANHSVLVSRDGNEYAIADSGAPIRDEHNKITGVVLVFRDQAAERAARKALRESEAKYSTVVEAAIDGIAIVQNGLIKFANKALEKMSGYSHQELIDRPLVDFIHPDDREKAIQRIRERVEGKPISGALEVRYLSKDRVLKYIEAQGNVIQYNAKPADLIFIRDITERIQAEAALRESEEKYRTLVESISDVIYAIDGNGVITYVSPVAKKAFGYEPDELIGRNFLELVHKEDHPLLIKRFSELRESNAKSADYRMIDKQDDIKWVRTLTNPVIEKGVFMGARGVLIDITERKKAEERVAASLREKEVLLREIHHRVKNNMQIISSLLRLQSRSIEDEKMREIFNESQSRIRSMSLIHEKLYESKDFSRVDFSDYIGKMVTHLFVVYQMKTQDVRFKVEAKDIHLEITEAIPCGLIINELVSNALKYAFPKGKKGDVIIRMNKDESGKYYLSVQDTGIGLPPDFDIHKTETLGFQIITDLVRQITGTIELKREKGTEFRIVF
jgi:PAS domain S-box-containing protein